MKLFQLKREDLQGLFLQRFKMSPENECVESDFQISSENSSIIILAYLGTLGFGHT
jgi:hypothetical protein